MTIIFTDSAAAKVNELIKEEGNTALKLRVFITGGGCSGFQYGFTFDETVNDDDTLIEKWLIDDPFWLAIAVNIFQQQTSMSNNQLQGLCLLLVLLARQNDKGNIATRVILLVDAMSFQYLMGAKIDYREDGNGAQFVIQNPNAKTTCGCGSSFSA